MATYEEVAIARRQLRFDAAEANVNRLIQSASARFGANPFSLCITVKTVADRAKLVETLGLGDEYQGVPLTIESIENPGKKR